MGNTIQTDQFICLFSGCLVPVLPWLFVLTINIKESKLQKLEQLPIETTYTPPAPTTSKNTEPLEPNSNTTEHLESMADVAEEISGTNDTLKDSTINTTLDSTTGNSADLEEKAEENTNIEALTPNSPDFVDIMTSSTTDTSIPEISDIILESTNFTDDLLEPTPTDDAETSEDDIMAGQMHPTVQNDEKEPESNDDITKEPEEIMSEDQNGEPAEEADESIQSAEEPDENSTNDGKEATEETTNSNQEITGPSLQTDDFLTLGVDDTTDDDEDDFYDDEDIWQIQDPNSLESLDEIESVWDVPFK